MRKPPSQLPDPKLPLLCPDLSSQVDIHALSPSPCNSILKKDFPRYIYLMQPASCGCSLIVRVLLMSFLDSQQKILLSLTLLCQGGDHTVRNFQV